MKNKAFFIGFAAILGVIAAVVLVNMMMVDGPVGPDGKKTREFKMLDNTVENLMLNVFKSPPPVSNHGKNVDRMIVFVHILMAILFMRDTMKSRILALLRKLLISLTMNFCLQRHRLL